MSEMSSSCGLPARALVIALEEAITVFDEQHKASETAKSRTETLRDRLDKMLEARIAGKKPDQPTFSDQGVGAQIETIRGFTELASRWEEAFCDISQALMRLYAFPQARHVAEQISGIVRIIRTLQTESAECNLPGGAFPSLQMAGNPDAIDLTARKKQMAKFTQEFFSNADTYYNKVMTDYQEKAGQTRRLLEEALDAARSLEILPEDK